MEALGGLLVRRWLLLGTLCLTGAHGSPLSAQQPAAESTPDLQSLVGAVVDVHLATGKPLLRVEVVKLVPGKSQGAIRSLSVRPAGTQRVQLVPCANVVELFRDGKPLDVAFDKRTRELAHDPAKRQARLDHEAKVEQQLRARRARLWEEIPAAEVTAFIEEEKKFFAEVAEKMQIKLELTETEYFLFYTDMPAADVKIYTDYLDAMYAMLCEAYGYPETRNIWRGKCPIVAFAASGDFYRFEEQIAKNPDPFGAQGICHLSTSGRAYVSCYRGNDPAFFATVLVHETAHGFNHRFKSTVFFPPWVEEGVADWVAGAVVTKSGEVKRRQREAADRIRQSRSLEGFFAPDAKLDRWQYGLGSSMVELLLRIDASRYRRFLEGMKEGLEPDAALQAAYGFGIVELTRRYGELIGVPNLQP